MFVVSNPSYQQPSMSAVDKIAHRHLKSTQLMSTLTQHFSLLLILALLLSPVQSLFASQQIDGTDVVTTSAATGDVIQNDTLKMLGDNCCSNLGQCVNCQDSAPCSSCSMLLGISQSLLMRTELNTQTQRTISSISLYSSDLLPDYRPPRYF